MRYDEYLDRLYGSILAKQAGIWLGVPLEPEPWTYETIREVFGKIDHFVARPEIFAADDDLNGPYYLARVLTDPPPGTPSLSPESIDIGEAWLQYTRAGVGMWWWGGAGISTEHTVYEHLRRGVLPPVSGSMELNGKVACEQIGGQIFSDCWGWMCPGLPEKAAELAKRAAGVSHDGEGVIGAMFIAAAIASAFTADSVENIIESAIGTIPPDSLYAASVRDISAFYFDHPGDFLPCMEYLSKHYGRELYPGICHIIPNACVCVLSLLYGGGDIGRSIETAVMCGLDTDCNAGSVGSILGAFRGSAGVPKRYREPISDQAAASGISGYLNNIDIPGFARELAHIGSLIAGIDEPGSRPEAGKIHYDFALKGSTHGMRLSEHSVSSLRQTEYMGKATLEIDMERVFNKLGPLTVYRHMFFREDDFEDPRYDPVFSPVVYPGQRFSCLVRTASISGGGCLVTPWLSTAINADEYLGVPTLVTDEGWSRLSWTLPDTKGDYIGRLGLKLDISEGSLVRIFISDFQVDGAGSWTIDPAFSRPEFGGLTPFSLHELKAEALREEGEFRLTAAGDRPGLAFTGNYYTRDLRLRGRIAGKDAGFVFRAFGTRDYCFAGLDREGRAVIGMVRRGETRILSRSEETSGDFPHEIKLRVSGKDIGVDIDSKITLSAVENELSHGMYGLFAGEGEICLGPIDVGFTL